MPLIMSAMPHFCWQIKVVPDQRPLTLGVIRHLSRGFKAQHLFLVSQQVYLFRAIDSGMRSAARPNTVGESHDIVWGFFSPLACSLTQMNCSTDGRRTSCELKAQTANIVNIMDTSYLTISFTFVIFHALFTHKHFVWFPAINIEHAVLHRCDNLIT